MDFDYFFLEMSAMGTGTSDFESGRDQKTAFNKKVVFMNNYSTDNYIRVNPAVKDIFSRPKKKIVIF